MALAPGAEFDALIAQYVMRWKTHKGIDVPTEEGRLVHWAQDGNKWGVYNVVPKFSRSALAWDVVRFMMKDGYQFGLAGYISGRWTANFYCPCGPCEKHGNTKDDWHGEKVMDEPSEWSAICRAALLTKMSEL